MNHAARIFDQAGFDVSDFSRRWQKARIAALEKSIESTESTESKNARKIAGDHFETIERELLLKVKAEQRDAVLRAVFDHSRQLGLSVVRHLGLCWEISDLVEILPQLGSPCFSGVWQQNNEAQVLKRAECGELATLGNLACDYWREALDGLVVGVGEDERLARHRSRGHGDAECLDVLFVENYTPPRIVSADSEVPRPKSIKYGPISSEVALALKPVQQRFQKMKIQLVLDGESEGVLYYRLDADEGVLCGAGGTLLHDSFTRELATLCPQLTARDSSPLAVYGGST